MFGEKTMRALIGAVGSVVVGSALLFAAVGPAQASATPVSQMQIAR